MTEKSEYVNDLGQRTIKVPDPYTGKLYTTTPAHRDKLSVDESPLCTMCKFNKSCKIQSEYERVSNRLDTSCIVSACGEFDRKINGDKKFF